MTIERVLSREAVGGVAASIVRELEWSDLAVCLLMASEVLCIMERVGADDTGVAVVRWLTPASSA